MSTRTMLALQTVCAQQDLREEVKPRNAFERCVVQALGTISWDEAIKAIRKHRQNTDACVKSKPRSKNAATPSRAR